MKLRPLCFSLLLLFTLPAIGAVATWPNFVVSPGGGGGTTQAVTNYFVVAGSGTTIVTNISGTNVTWTITATGGSGGGGNMTNSGPAVAGNLPVYTDTTGTQVTPTNAVNLVAVQTDQMLFTDLLPNGFAYLGSLTNLTNAPYIPMRETVGTVVATGTNAAGMSPRAADASGTNVVWVNPLTTNAPNIAVGSIVKMVASNVVGAATSGDLQTALGTNFTSQISGSMFFAIPATLTPTGTNAVVDFSGSALQLLTASTDLYFSASSLVAGKSVLVDVVAGTTNRNLSFDPSFVWLCTQPISIASNHVAWVSLTATTTAASGVRISYAASQP